MTFCMHISHKMERSASSDMESLEAPLSAKRGRDEPVYRGLDPHGRPTGVVFRSPSPQTLEQALARLAARVLEDARTGASTREY